jgi:hypothetical protein
MSPHVGGILPKSGALCCARMRIDGGINLRNVRQEQTQNSKYEPR